MVTTRKSLGGANKNRDPTISNDKATQAALRKLEIDGQPALIGGEIVTKRGEKEVYHWRGSVYEVTGNEPEEWLEAQPDRHRKRLSTEQSTRASERDVIASRKRKSSHNVGAETLEDTASKRPRRDIGTMLEREANKSRFCVNGTLSDEEDDQDLRAGITGIDGTNDRPVRRAPIRDREEARERGLKVEAISEKQIDRNVGLKVADLMYGMAKLNSKMDRYWARYNEYKAFLENVGETRQTVDKAKNKEAERKGSKSTNLTSKIESRAGTTQAELNTARPSIETSKRRTESATPRVSREIPTIDLTAKTPTPPRQMKGKQRHDSARVSKEPSRPSSSNGLRNTINYDRFKETGRAQDAIHMGRLEGESKSARRRRIRRELAVLRDWQIKSE